MQHTYIPRRNTRFKGKHCKDLNDKLKIFKGTINTKI